MTPVPVIAGPTASGKSDLAVEAALALIAMGRPAEIVTADAYQIYRGLDIGTAKPTLAERRGIPHHLIDIVAPTERFTVADWLAAAHAAIAEIQSRGAVPIVVGGTHLYVKALLDGLFDGPPADAALRDELRAMGRDTLRAELERIDPAAAARIHPNDERRTIRAIEVFRLTGKTITSQQTQWDATPLLGSPALRAGPLSPSSSPWLNLAHVSHLLSHQPHTFRPAGFVPRDPYPEGMYGPVPGLVHTRRKLPHLLLPDATYFVSWHTLPGEWLSDAERTMALNALMFFDGKRCRVYAVCVMSNHVHWMVRPYENVRLSDLIESVKRFSAREINAARGRVGSLWDPEDFDHIVRGEKSFVECLDYLIQNPVEAGMVERGEEYAWTRVHADVIGPSQPPGSESRATQERATQYRLFTLQWPTEELNRRINSRVRGMTEAGLLSEVRGLWQSSRLGPQAREALGYKQLIDHLEGRCSEDDAVERIKIETRRFAKNQRTWLRRLGITPGAVAFDAPSTPKEAMIAQVLRANT